MRELPRLDVPAERRRQAPRRGRAPARRLRRAPVATCGDGVAAGTEECDDGDTDSGDGCSATCELENTSAVCAGVPSAAGTALDSVVLASGLDRPTDVQSPRLDPRRIFVVEQSGRIRLVKDGVLQAAPFINLTSKTSTACPFSEQGLLGLAFHPDYETNGFFYVNYTNPSGTTVLARYTATGDPETADTAAIGTRGHPAHDRAAVREPQRRPAPFGPDGSSTSAWATAAAAAIRRATAQNLDHDCSARCCASTSTRSPYAIPPTTRRRRATRDLGLRACATRGASASTAANGDLYIGDVGQNQREEVDVVAWPVPAGLNYGWDFYEGEACANTLSCSDSVCPPSTAGFTMPILTFSHAGACSISGGYVYRGCALPALHGTYFYSDFCGAFVRTFNFVGGAATNQQDRTADVDPPGADTITSVSSFGQDARGEIYIVERGDCSSSNGVVYKFVPQP